MDDLEQSLSQLTLAPYIVKAMALIGVQRRGGSNMFRHQLSTLAILLDYKLVDSVLLKAAVIHDLFEDAATLPGVSEEAIARLDSDGPAVVALVMEVTIRVVDGVKEKKSDFLLRIMHRAAPGRSFSSWRIGSATSTHSASCTTASLSGAIWTRPARAFCPMPRRSTPTCSGSCPTSSAAASVSWGFLRESLKAPTQRRK